MSKKLRLNVEDLVVESFTPGVAPDLKGTVHGNVGTRYCSVNNTCGEYTCGIDPTCNVLAGTCAPSCGACDTHECGGDGDTLVCGSDGSGITGCMTCLVNC